MGAFLIKVNAPLHASNNIWWASGHLACVHAQSLCRVRLCDPMDCSTPGSSVHGILQARILGWVPISFSRGTSWPRDRTHVSCTGIFTIWAIRKGPWYLGGLLNSFRLTNLRRPWKVGSHFLLGSGLHLILHLHLPSMLFSWGIKRCGENRGWKWGSPF